MNAPLNSVLAQDGVVSTVFLSNQHMESLTALYRERASQVHEHAFHSTMFVEDPEHRAEISTAITVIVQERIDTLLPDFEVVFANFIVKKPSPHTAVGIHQDWSLSTPDQTTAILWIPLCDINEQNGAFYALPGSQKAFKNIRYTPYETDRFADLESYIRSHSTAYFPRAGDCICYDGAMVHYSDPNLSSSDRVAVGIALVPKGAPLRHYYKPDSQKSVLEVYAVNKSFYHSFNFLSSPSGSPVVEYLKEYPSLPSLYELEKTMKVYHHASRI
jgi:ectoine hydroxylase-related dioxygenase (phytanoyl-CoA dioxygenase family)